MEITPAEKKTHLGIRVTTSLKKRLKEAAKGSGVNLTGFTTQLLAWALGKHEAEEARRAEKRRPA